MKLNIFCIKLKFDALTTCQSPAQANCSAPIENELKMPTHLQDSYTLYFPFVFFVPALILFCFCYNPFILKCYQILRSHLNSPLSMLLFSISVEELCVYVLMIISPIPLTVRETEEEGCDDAPCSAHSSQGQR